MDYVKDTDGETKYYTVDKQPEEKKEEQKLPTFQDIFYDLPTSGSISSYCTFYNGVIYFPCMDTHVYALEATTGKMIWKFKTGAPIVWSAPLVHNNKIYFGSFDEHFYCLDLAGKLLWKKHLGDIIVTAPIAIGDKVLIGNGKGYFFCFSEDGDEKWRFLTGDGIVAIPSFVNGMVFVGSYDKHVYALDLETGELKWKFLAGERIGSPLVMHNGKNIVSNHKRSFDKMPEFDNPVLYCGSYDNYLYALNDQGKELWRFNCNSSIPGGIGGDNGIVYVGTVVGYLYALDEEGREKWKFKTGAMVTGGAEVSNGRIYLSSMDQRMYCLNEEGKKIWDFLTGGPIVARPLIVENKIYFGSGDAFLYCLNTEKRSVEWTFQVGSKPSEAFQNKVDGFINAFSEYDKKIFKVWVPETSKAGQKGSSLHGYKAPSGLSFGGEEVYKSSTGAYVSDLSYFGKGKKGPYKK